MSLTLAQIIAISIVGLILIALSIVSIFDDYKKIGVGLLIGSLILILGAVFFCNWYNTNTANGIRDYKDFQSNLSNGIEREIRITAEDGREIFYYEGKVDVESDHEDNYIKFESEDGKRYIIYYGVTDTIVIKEK